MNVIDHRCKEKGVQELERKGRDDLAIRYIEKEMSKEKVKKIGR